MTRLLCATSSAGVACPKCDALNVNRAELSLLIPDQPTEWGCAECGAKFRVEYSLQLAAYIAKMEVGE